jgi:hypothetical protein
MFILRSAFWLTLAFLLVAPPGADLAATATGLRDQAVTTGVATAQRIVAGQVLDPARLPDLLLSAAPAVALPLPGAPAPLVPRPRPAALG